jgi:hypothetical protein
MIVNSFIARTRIRITNRLWGISRFYRGGGRGGIPATADSLLLNVNIVDL